MSNKYYHVWRSCQTKELLSPICWSRKLCFVSISLCFKRGFAVFSGDLCTSYNYNRYDFLVYYMYFTWAERSSELFWSHVVRLLVSLSLSLSVNFSHFHLFLQFEFCSIEWLWYSNQNSWNLFTTDFLKVSRSPCSTTNIN